MLDHKSSYSECQLFTPLLLEVVFMPGQHAVICRNNGLVGSWYDWFLKKVGLFVWASSCLW